jgi:chorismate mutase
MAVRGIRGATTVSEDSKEEILLKTEELLLEIVKNNKLQIDDIASAFFSMTDDLTAEFPAVAARKIGWNETPLFCTKELSVNKALKKCIRVLLHVNSDKKQSQVAHVYLHEAKSLRPDIK